MAKQRYTAAEVIKAINATAGIKTAAAKRLSCDVDTIDNYAKRYPTVAEALQQARAGIVDIAESVLVRRLNAGEWDAAKFVLTTLGKDRGWGNSIDVNVKIEELARKIAAETGEPFEDVLPVVTDLASERKRRRTA